MGSYPRVLDAKGGSKVWFVWAVSLGVVLDPIVVFSNTVVMDGGSRAPKEIQEVQRTGGYRTTFVQVVRERGIYMRVSLELSPTMVLEMA
jgi:hypothetical protein